MSSSKKRKRSEFTQEVLSKMKKNQPKRLSLTEWNSHGIFFREPFHFREPNFFAFFTQI